MNSHLQFSKHFRKNMGTKKIQDPELMKTKEKNYYQAEASRLFIDKKIILIAGGGEIEENKIYWK